MSYGKIAKKNASLSSNKFKTYIKGNEHRPRTLEITI